MRGRGRYGGGDWRSRTGRPLWRSRGRGIALLRRTEHVQAQQRHHEARLFIRCQRQLLTAMHGNLVGQLDKLRVEPCRQIEQTGAFRKVVSHRLRRQLRHLQTGQQYGEFLQRGHHRRLE